MDAKRRRLVEKLDSLVVAIAAIVRELREDEAPIPQTMLKRFVEFAEKGLCLACEKPLGAARSKRGCHSDCYDAAKALVDSGATTFHQLMMKGSVGPPGKPGRKQQRERPALDAATHELIYPPTVSTLDKMKKAASETAEKTKKSKTKK